MLRIIDHSHPLKCDVGTVILSLIFKSFLLMEAFKYVGAELVAKKSDECMAYSWDSACIRRMEWAWVRWHNVQHGEGLAIESSTWISTFDRCSRMNLLKSMSKTRLPNHIYIYIYSFNKLWHVIYVGMNYEVKILWVWNKMLRIAQ